MIGLAGSIEGNVAYPVFIGKRDVSLTMPYNMWFVLWSQYYMTCNDFINKNLYINGLNLHSITINSSTCKKMAERFGNLNTKHAENVRTKGLSLINNKWSTEIALINIRTRTTLGMDNEDAYPICPEITKEIYVEFANFLYYCGGFTISYQFLLKSKAA